MPNFCNNNSEIAILIFFVNWVLITQKPKLIKNLSNIIINNICIDKKDTSYYIKKKENLQEL